jgi:hypothetical protein
MPPGSPPRALFRELRLKGVDLGLTGLNFGPGLVQRGPQVPVVDTRQYLAGLDRLIILDQHRRYIARHPRRDDGRIRLHIGIIGGDHETRSAPVVRRRGHRQNQYREPADHCQKVPPQPLHTPAQAVRSGVQAVHG